MIISRAKALLTGLIILVTAITIIQLFRSNQTSHSDLPVFEGMGGEFSMPGTLGREISTSEFHGKIVLLTFGYTSCPDVCPMVLNRMRSAMKKSSLSPEQIQLVFITVDPERDTIEGLTSYLNYFHSSIIGMRGTSEQLEKAAKLYKLYFEKQSSADGSTYDFIHSDRIYLLDQEGKVRATFANTITPEMMAADIKRLP